MGEAKSEQMNEADRLPLFRSDVPQSPGSSGGSLDIKSSASPNPGKKRGDKKSRLPIQEHLNSY